MSLIHLLLPILPVGNLFSFIFSWSPGLPPADCAATVGHKRTPSTKPPMPFKQLPSSFLLGKGLQHYLGESEKHVAADQSLSHLLSNHWNRWTVFSKWHHDEVIWQNANIISCWLLGLHKWSLVTEHSGSVFCNKQQVWNNLLLYCNTNQDHRFLVQPVCTKSGAITEMCLCFSVWHPKFSKFLGFVSLNFLYTLMIAVAFW